MSFDGFAWAIVAVTLFQFVVNWAGYYNGPIRFWWGDPLTFHDAVANLPRDFATAVITTCFCVAISGVRSSHQDSGN